MIKMTIFSTMPVIRVTIENTAALRAHFLPWRYFPALKAFLA